MPGVSPADAPGIASARLLLGEGKTTADRDRALFRAGRGQALEHAGGWVALAVRTQLSGGGRPSRVASHGTALLTWGHTGGAWGSDSASLGYS